MLKTKDGYDLYVGQWIYDTTGTYEVIKIYDTTVLLREVIWTDPDETENASLDDYRLDDDVRVIMKREVKNFNWI